MAIAEALVEVKTECGEYVQDIVYAYGYAEVSTPCGSSAAAVNSYACKLHGIPVTDAMTAWVFAVQAVAEATEMAVLDVYKRAYAQTKTECYKFASPIIFKVAIARAVACKWRVVTGCFARVLALTPARSQSVDEHTLAILL